MPKAARTRRHTSPLDAQRLDQQLLAAVHDGDVHAVRRLLAQGANVRTVDQNKDEPLHCALTTDDASVELVDVLLAHGADINALGYAFPPLQIASNLGNLPMVKHLVAHSADVHGVNEQGQTALHAAAEYGSMDVYDYLLTLGLRADQMDRDGRTPQDYLDALDEDDDGSGDDDSDAGSPPPPPVTLVSLAAGRRATREILDALTASLVARRRGGRSSGGDGDDTANVLRSALAALRDAVASARQRPHMAQLAAEAAMALAALVAHADVSPTAAAALGATAVVLLATYASSAASFSPVWESLARAVVRPLRSVLAPVHAYAQAIRALPTSTAMGAVRLFGHEAATRDASAVRTAHADGVAALKTLDKLAPVVVAAWSRLPEVLREYQGEFVDTVRDLGFRSSDGIYWLSLLLSSSFALPVVVLVPELEEAYTLVADGVVQMAQLCILLGAMLAEPLRRLGAHPQSYRAAARALAAPDDGSQPSIIFKVPFHVFPWQAMDPQTRRPALLRHMWTAPDGRGGHSLPADFLVGDLARINGHAVIVLVGPRSPELTQGLVRWVSTDRPFPALPARVTGVRQLARSEAAEWFQTAADMAPAARVAPTERDLLVLGPQRRANANQPLT